MKQVKRIISLLMAAVLMLGICTGCKSDKDDGGVPGLLVDGKEVKIENVAMVGDEGIPYDQFRYFFLTLVDQAEASGALETDKETTEEYIINSALESVLSNYVVKQIAAEVGQELSAEDMEMMKSSAESAKEQFSSLDEYEARLEQMHLTEDLYLELLTNQYLDEKVYNYLCGTEFLQYKDEAFAEIKEKYVRASHILVDDKSLAEELTMRARAGEDFDTLVADYGGDPGMENNPDGYYFTEGEMVTEFYEGTLALEEGEISDPIKSEYGYHVIKRLPLEDEYLEKNLVNFFKKTTVIADVYKKYIDDRIAALEITPDEHFGDISLDSVR